MLLKFLIFGLILTIACIVFGDSQHHALRLIRSRRIKNLASHGALLHVRKIHSHVQERQAGAGSLPAQTGTAIQ